MPDWIYVNSFCRDNKHVTQQTNLQIKQRTNLLIYLYEKSYTFLRLAQFILARISLINKYSMCEKI